MSTTIDQRVVEMRFDNKQFENATRTTMSTLDKLKQKLNLTGASKGLEEVNHAAKKVDMGGLGSAVESVGKKFSAMEIMGVTALVNLTNQAVNAGKRIVSALTVAPIGDGFEEYEMTLNAIQTTMNATGKSAEEVKEQLKLLDEYADKTVYSTADMLNNLSKFTNAGVDLETSVKAMIGIANATAHAGGNANNATTAWYNLGQSIGTGFMTRMDYKSINDANVVTMELKNRLVDAAIAAGTLTKVGEDAYQAGNKTLSLQQLFIEGLQEQWATTDVMLKVFGDYGDETTDIGKKAYKAAQDIRTFSMMMDSLKASAGTGWKETWEHVFGSLPEATKFWTDVYNVISGIIGKTADWRNKLIEGAMGSPLIGAYVKIIEELNDKANTMKGALDTAASAMDNFGKIVDRVMSGEFGNGQARWDKLTEAGYNWAEVQNKVNEKMGSSVRHATELGKAQGTLAKTEEEVQEVRAQTIEQLVDMSDEELKALKIKPQEIKALRELKEMSEKTGIPVKELAKDLSLLNGRSLLINSFKNIGDSLVKTFNAMKTAWKDTFDPITSDHLYNVIAGFHKLTTYLEVNEETADKLTRTFKGVFAILDIITTLTAGPLKIAFKAIKSLLGAFDLDILDVTASIGDAIVSFRDRIDEVVNFDEAFKHVTDYLKPLTDAISNWVDGLKNTDDIHQYIIDGIIGAIVKVKDFLIQGFKDLKSSVVNGMDNVFEAMLTGWSSIPTNITEGFNKGFLVGIASIIKNIRSFCTKFINTVKSMFGIHSPSRVMFEIGQNVIQGFINGVIGLYDAVIGAVKNLFTGARDTIVDIDFSKPLDAIVAGVKKFGSKVAEVFGEIDFGKIFAAALGVGMLVVAKKAIDVLEMFGKPLEGFGDMLSGIGEAFEGFGKNLKANAFKKNAQAILIISGAILVLVMAILPLTELSWEQLAKAGLSIAALAGIMIAMAKLLDGVGKVDAKGNAKSSLASTAKLIIMAGSLFLVAFAIKKLSEVGLDGSVKDTIIMLAAVVGSLALVMLAFGKFVSADKGGNIDKAGVMIFKMAAALLTITTVIKIVSGFTYSDINKGLKFVVGVGVLFSLVIAVSKLAGEHADKAGSMMLKMSFAMLLMAGVVKIASGFTDDELKRGLKFVAGVEILFAGLIAISHLSGKNAKKAGKMISSMGIAMLAMVLAIKIVAGIDETDLNKGLGVVSALMILFAGVVAVSKFAGEHAIKAGIMLLAMSIALGIMVGITFIVSKLDPKEMWKGLAFVAALEAMMAGLIVITKYAKATDKLNGTLTRFIIIVALMVAAVIALSFIDPKSLAAATGALGGVMGMFAVMMAATKYTKNTKDMRKSLVMLLGVTVVLAAVIAALSLLNPDSALKSATSLSVLLLAFSSSIVILSKAGRVSKTAIDALKPMLVIAAGLGGILAVFGILNKFGMEASLQSAISLGVLLNAFAASIVILSKAGSVSKSAMAALNPMLIVAGGLGGILAVFGILNKFGMEPSIQSAAALGVLLNAFTASIVILGKAGSVSKSALAALQPMVLVTAELAVILGLMSALNVEASIPSAIALGVLLNLLATSVVILSYAGPSATAAIPAAIAMGLVVMELALAMGIMASMDVDSAIPYAISLGILLTALTVGVGILGLIAPLIPAAIPAVVGLGVVIAELAILLAAMGGLSQIPGLEWLISEGGDFLQTIGTALGQFVGGIIGGIAQGAASVLPEIANSLSGFMENIQPFIDGAQSINSDVLKGVGYLAGAILLLTAADLLAGIATFGRTSFASLGLELRGFILAALPFIVAIQTIDPSAVDAAKSLAEMILILTAADLISGITSFLGGGSVNFSEFGAQLATFGDAVCEFSNKLTVNGGIDEGAITAAANAGTLLAELNKSLPRSGGWIQDIIGEKDFGTFADSCRAFAECILDINEIVSQEGFVIQSEKLKQLAEAGGWFSELNASLPRSGGIAQDLAGEKDLAGFGSACIAFVSCMKAINASISQEDFVIQTEKIDQIVSAGTKFSELNAALPRTDGVAQDLAGEKDLATFGASVSAFVSLMKGVSLALGEEGFVVPLESFDDIKTAGEKLLDLQSVLPKTGGWWQDIAGESDIGDFGSKIKSFGDAIVAFSNSAVGLDTAGIDLSIRTANRIKNLITSLAGLDTSGVAIFTGVGIGGVGADGAAYAVGQAIASFSTVVAGIDTNAVSTSVSAAQKLKTLISGLVDLDPSGIENFKVASLASRIKSYADTVADIDTMVVSSSINSANRLKNLIIGLVDLDTSGVNLFASVKNIGSSLKAYSDNIGELNTDAINSSVGGARQLVNLINGMAGIDTSGVASFKDAVTKLATTDINGLVENFKDTSKFTSIGTNIVNAILNGITTKQVSMTTAGNTLVTHFTNGVSSKRPTVITTIGTIISDMITEITSKQETFHTTGTLLMSKLNDGVTGQSGTLKTTVGSAVAAASNTIRSYYNSFYNAGTYLVDGFVDGISAKIDKAAKKAASMAKAAADAAKEELDINSPSKVFRAIGYSVPEGFAMGIDRLAYMVKNSAVGMADTAVNSVSNSIAQIAEAVNTDIDAQPTIRPVVDLSDVRSGASAISGLFDMNPSVGVMANANSIGSMMNSRQNGVGAGDVVSAINKLRDGLNNIGNTNYNVNGITYSNGSDVADAIKVLTHAALVEGRI